MSRSRLKVFFDGGCRPNPGPIEAAAVVRGETHVFADLGGGTNADAEWSALIRALELVQSLGLDNVELIGDALEIVRRANVLIQGGRPESRHEEAFLALTAKALPARIRWIRREQNLAGIALARNHPR